MLTSVAVAIGMLLQVGAWNETVQGSDVTQIATVMIVAVALASLLGQLLRLGGLAAIGLKLLTFGAVTLGLIWWHEGLDALATIPVEMVEAGYRWTFGQIAEAPATGTLWLAAIIIGAMSLVADALATTLERPGWASVPLLVTYLAPTLLAPGSANPADFVRLGAAVVLVLVSGTLEDREHHLPGTRGLPTRAAALGFASAVGAAAIGSTILVGEKVKLEPLVTVDAGPIEMNDPSLDLKRNLVEGSPDTIIRFRTDQPNPPPLRLVSLPMFSDSGFHLAQTRIVRGPLPRAPKVSAADDRRVTEVEIGDFSSEWLPTPFVPLAVDVDDRWGYTEHGLDMLALGFPGRTSATKGMTYTVSSADIRPSDDEIAGLVAGRPADSAITLEIPDGVSPRMRQLVSQVTIDAKTDGQKATAIEDFLRSDPFVYSTEPAPGTGVAGLETFLFDTHAGYCEQYAGAMAAMARIAGIPSRIGIGFNPGEPEADGAWNLSEKDMHAWPELYFDEWGWVAFEPTPGRGAAAEPDPAQQESEQDQQLEEPEPTTETEPEPTTDAPADADPDPSQEPGFTTPWWIMGALLAFGVAAAGPAVFRVWQTRRRLDPSLRERDAVLAAWAELRATASDLSMEWPDGSPRHLAIRLIENHGIQGETADAMMRLALAEERALYADPEHPLPATNVREDTLLVKAAWSAGVSPHQRRRAILWPRSVLKR